MKQHTFIIKISKYCSVLCILLFLFPSCSIDDDRRDCPDGLWATFKYKYISQQRNGTVSQMDLFVFDDQGILYSHEIEYEIPIDGTFRKRLWLNPGNYTFVAWTGLSEEDTYSCGDMTIGKTRLDELQLKLAKINNNKVDYKPGLLLHGFVADYPVRLKRNDEVVIPIVQDNNLVKVIVSQKGKAISEYSFKSLELNISDNNSTYFFDNKIDESASTFQYTPFYNVKEENLIDCDFHVLKLQERENGPVVTINNVEGDQIIFKDDLISLIRKVNEIYGSQIDLERDTFFKIEIVLNQTSAIVSIAINGWVIVNQGSVVG